MAHDEYVTTTENPTRFPLDTVQADHETRSKNSRRAASSRDVADLCFTCGRPLTAKALASAWWVNLACSGQLIAIGATDIADGDDQGWFPLGSECAKQVPAGFKAKITRVQ